MSVPDPADRHKSLGTTDHMVIENLVAVGAVRAGGDYWLEIHDAPADGSPADLSKATFRFGALVSGGLTYRNDGDGWYQTNSLPGIGLDPKTVALLPAMLKGFSNAAAMTDGKNLAATATRGVRGNSKADSMPGLIAPDALGFTDLSRPLEIGFDDQGLPASIHAVARNTNLGGYDMLVDTFITFSYPLMAPDIPRPDPLIDPNATTKAKG